MPAWIHESPPESIEAIMFDKDGVLNPSTYGHHLSFGYSAPLIGGYSVQQHAEREVLREVFDRDPDLVEWSQYANQGREKIWRETQSDNTVARSVEYRLACAEWQASYMRSNPEVSQLAVGARKLLIFNYESPSPVPIAIVTSSDRPILEAFIEVNDIGELIQATVAHKEAGGKNKPYPDPYLMAAQELGVQPSRSVGVEDSENGILSLWKANVYRVAVAGPNSIDEIDRFAVRANATVDCMGDLGKVLGWNLV